jgi:hypothetical protein
MRKQSVITLIEKKKKPVINLKPVKNEDLDAANEYLGLVSAPSPLHKPPLNRISVLIPTEELRKKLGPQDRKRALPVINRAVSTPSRDQSSLTTLEVEPQNPFESVKQSNDRANKLVDSILKEDQRWTNVPDSYPDYKPEDFVFKLDSTKLEVWTELSSS